ncbi:MAG: 3-oxoacyl-[acyl-carrier-protein] synthase III C-terminal domain-containing protein [Asticcacaulis sp.]
MSEPVGLKIVGSGIYRPREARNSSVFDSTYGQAAGWTQGRFGIASRAVADETETTSVMAAMACRQALAEAGWDADFDVLIGGCAVMEQPIPGTSVLVSHELGLGKSGIHCFDVNMTCLSFLTALDVVSLGFRAGRWRRALIFASDIASAGLDYQHPEMSAIFGDGAAAICVEAGDSDGPAVLSAGFKTFSAGKDLGHLKSGGTRVRIADGFEALKTGSRFHMDAFGIFKAAGKHMPALMKQVAGEAGLELGEIDLFIPHQASHPALEYVRHVIGERPERVVDIFATYGNQIAASLPTALCVARAEGRLKAGQPVMLLGTSAGVSLGVMVLRC